MVVFCSTKLNDYTFSTDTFSSICPCCICINTLTTLVNGILVKPSYIYATDTSVHLSLSACHVLTGMLLHSARHNLLPWILLTSPWHPPQIVSYLFRCSTWLCMCTLMVTDGKDNTYNFYDVISDIRVPNQFDTLHIIMIIHTLMIASSNKLHNKHMSAGTTFDTLFNWGYSVTLLYIIMFNINYKCVLQYFPSWLTRWKILQNALVNSKIVV